MLDFLAGVVLFCLAVWLVVELWPLLWRMAAFTALLIAVTLFIGFVFAR